MAFYDPEKLKGLVAKIAVAAGVPQDDAIVFADSLVEADVLGTGTHGISRLNVYLRRILKELIDPAAELRIDRKRGAALAVDAGNGLGQVQASKVLDMLLPLARSSGVAVATIRNSQHFGALSYYCNRAARER